MMLKFASWNVRGLNDLSKQDEVVKFISKNNISLCAIIKTRIRSFKVAKICNKVFFRWEWLTNMDSCVGGTRIIVGWDPGVVMVSIINQTDQVVNCKVTLVNNSGKWFYCSFVYAKNDHVKRRHLWESLQMFGAFDKIAHGWSQGTLMSPFS